MTQSVITIIFSFYISVSFAQLNVSTNGREDFIWDSENKDWVFDSEDDESLTFFEFNEEFTYIKHTSKTQTSGYLIKSQEHDEEDGNNQYLFTIVSDVGNKYIMIYDIKNKNIRFITEDITRMIKFKIKSVWTDE